MNVQHQRASKRRHLVACMVVAIAIAMNVVAGANAGVTHIGVNYDSHWQQSLELYIPDHYCGPLPLVVFIHGGGWLAGSSENVAPFLDELLERGFAVAALNHRWSTNAIFPAQIHDCKGAVRFLRAHAATYDIDPTRFVAFGDSSGGHLAALLGTSGGVPSLEGTVGGNLGQSSRVLAVGDFFGPTDLFALGAIHNGPQSIVSQLFGHWIQDIINNMNNPAYANLVALVHSANPITHVTVDDAVFRIVHGENDTYVPPSQSQILHDALTQAGVSSTLTIVPGVGHNFPVVHYEPVFDFFAQLLNAHPIHAADVTCDGAVNVNDLLAVISAWGPCPAPPQPCPADITLDDVVNVNDLLEVIGDWG